MNLYIDVSNFKQNDIRYWDISGNMSNVAAHVKLSCSYNQYDIPVDLDISKIVLNAPVKYQNGIFRVKKVLFSGGILEIEIEGTFSSSDPDGYVLNGWTEEELTGNGTRSFYNSIAELEV